MSETITPAHTGRETVTIEYQYPEHAPRESDVHYHLFHEAVARIRRLGRWRCWIGNADCDTANPLEAHHSLCEFSLAPDVDVKRFAELYPEFGVTDDETFLAFVEGEGNLTVLCRRHHRQYLGVHVLPYPVWITQRFLRAGVAAPAREVSPQAAPPSVTVAVAGVSPEDVAVTVAPQAGPLPAPGAIEQGAPN